MRWLGVLGVFLVMTCLTYWLGAWVLAYLLVYATPWLAEQFTPQVFDNLIFIVLWYFPPMVGMVAAMAFLVRSDWPLGFPRLATWRHRREAARFSAARANFRAAFGVLQGALLDPALDDATYDAHLATLSPATRDALAQLLSAEGALAALLNPATPQQDVVRVLEALVPAINEANGADPVAALRALTRLVTACTPWTSLELGSRAMR